MLSDTRVSFVIRAGVVEMCLGFIERFGVDNTLYDVIHETLKCIYSISLHTKSAKAIKSKRQDIEKKLDSAIMNSTKSNIEKLLRLSEQKGDPSFVNTMLDMRKNNGTCAPHPKIKKLLDIVRSMLDINGSYCCRCNKSLSKTEVMECNGCHRMSYCSRACQKEDWLNGHSVTCCKSYIDEKAGQFQGMLQPSALPENERAATKLKELEINFTMVQLNIFLDHSDTILSQAKSLDIPLHDCIAVFDLRGCPMKVETFSYTHDKSVFSCCDSVTCGCNNGYFESIEERKRFETTRSKDNITCVYISRRFIGRDDIKDGDKPVLLLQRFFPHEWLTSKNF